MCNLSGSGGQPPPPPPPDESRACGAGILPHYFTRECSKDFDDPMEQWWDQYYDLLDADTATQAIETVGNQMIGFAEAVIQNDDSEWFTPAHEP